MLFLLLCLYTALYYIRPFEWSEALQGVPVFLCLGVISILALLVAWMTGRIRLFRHKTDVMMIGFVASIAISHIGHGYLGGAFRSVLNFLPSIVGYFLVAYGIDSRKKIQGFIVLLVCLTSFLAYEAHVQSTQGMTHGGMQAYIQFHSDPDGEKIGTPRARWFGPFNDPNDLGLALVLPVPFLINRLLNRRLVLASLSLPLLIYGLYLTNSRGAMLSLLASVFTFLILRYRSMKGAALGAILAAVLLVLGPSRMVQMSGGDASAYGRVEAWHAGFQMFKSSPLFGVGKGMFTDFHPITAHNTYLLVLAELGIIGLFFFIGFFYYNLQWTRLFVLKQPPYNDRITDRDLLSATMGCLTGLLVSITFLSRAYFELIYIMVAFASVLVTANAGKAENCKYASTAPSLKLKSMTGAVVMVIIVFNLMVKFLI